MMSVVLLFLQMTFAASNLEGTFARSCYLVGDDALSARLQVQGSAWTQSYTAYEEETCQTPYLIYEVQSEALVKDESLDLETREVSYVSLTDEVTRALNMVSYCGFRDWKTSQKKIVTGLQCDEFQAPKIGEKTFTSFKLVKQVSASDELYLGKEDATYSGKTPETRHRLFETTPYLKTPQP